MANQFVIPHPNIPTTDIGLPKLKEITVKNNENFLALDKLCKVFVKSITDLDDGRADKDHNHDDKYSPLGHTHQMAEVEGLIEALANKAAAVHTHEMTSINGLIEALDVKADVSALATKADVSALATKADAVHTHNIGEVEGLSVELSKKATWDAVNWLASNIMISKRGTPVNVGGSSPWPNDEEIVQSASTLWEYGLGDGANLVVLFRGKFDGGHQMYAARLELMSDGRISKIVALKDTGVWINA